MLGAKNNNNNNNKVQDFLHSSSWILHVKCIRHLSELLLEIHVGNNDACVLNFRGGRWPAHNTLAFLRKYPKKIVMWCKIKKKFFRCGAILYIYIYIYNFFVKI
jgi:hypothetical protein